MLGVDDFGQLSVADHLLVHPHLDGVLKAGVLLGIVADDDGQRGSPTRYPGIRSGYQFPLPMIATRSFVFNSVFSVAFERSSSTYSVILSVFL